MALPLADFARGEIRLRDVIEHEGLVRESFGEFDRGGKLAGVNQDVVGESKSGGAARRRAAKS